MYDKFYTEREGAYMSQMNEDYISTLNVMDDLLFHKIAEDAGACEEIIQTILQKDDIKIIENHAQKYLRNIKNRSVILDALCVDATGKYYNIEIQKADDTDHQKRVRYHGSNIDTLFTEKAIDFEELPDVYIIYICAFDIFGANKVLYHIERMVRETGEKVSNGFHEIYANSQGNEENTASELMKYLSNSQGIHPKFPKLSNRVDYFKTKQKGRIEMSSVIEKIEQEGIEKGIEKGIETIIKTMFQNKMPIAEISKMTEVPIEKIEKIIAK